MDRSRIELRKQALVSQDDVQCKMHCKVQCKRLKLMLYRIFNFFRVCFFKFFRVCFVF